MALRAERKGEGWCSAVQGTPTPSTGTDRPHTPRAIEMIENMAERASGLNYLSDKYIACLAYLLKAG